MVRAPSDSAEGDLARVADVDEHEIGDRLDPHVERCGGQTRQRFDNCRIGLERVDWVFERAAAHGRTRCA